MKTFLRSLPCLTWVFLLIVGVILGPSSGVALAVDKSWNNPNGGDFNVASNWTPAGVPSAGDQVVITLPGTYTVTMDAPNNYYTISGLELGGASGTQTLDITDGSTNDYPKFTVTNSCLVNRRGQLKLRGISNFAGAFQIDGELDTSSVNMRGGVSKQISSTGVVNMEGSFTSGGTLYNSGSVTISSGEVSIGAIVNQAGGKIESVTGSSKGFYGVNFTNAAGATFICRGGDFISMYGAFSNLGNIEIQQNSLNIQGNDSTLSGNYSVLTGAQLLLTGTFTTGNAAFSGSGEVDIAGILNVETSWTLTPGVTWYLLNDGYMRGLGSKNIAKNTVFSVSNKRFGYSPPTIEGGPLNNSGTINMENGTLRSSNGCAINNERGGVFNVKKLYNSLNSSTTKFNFINKDGGTVVFDTNNFTIGNANFVNSGLFYLKSGKMNVGNPGRFEQTSTGVLKIVLHRTGTTSIYQNQQLNMNNGAGVALGGTLQLVEPEDESFNIGDQFQLLTYDSQNGAFSLPDTRYQAIYNPTNLTVVKAQSQPNDFPSVPLLFAPLSDAEVISDLTFQVAATNTESTQKLTYRIDLLQNDKVIQTLQTAANWDKTGYASGETATCRVEHLVPGVYQWRAQAFDGIVWSPYSSTSNFTYAIAGGLPLDTPTEFLFGANQVLQTTFTSPAAPDLWVTIQKKERTWVSTARLLFNGSSIASANSADDILLHVTNPQAGDYQLEITAQDAGSLVVRAGTNLPKIDVGKQFVGTIYHNDGNDWAQIDVPDGASELDLTGETVGNISTLDVWKGTLSGNPQWTATQSFNPPVKLSIAQPSAGRYYLRMHDHGDLSSSGTQVRQYSVLSAAVDVSPPSVSGITPNHGGNSGSVTFTLSGASLDSGATVKLIKAGAADIVATSVSGNVNQTKLSGSFNLQGTVAGLYDVVVYNPDGKVVTFAKAFTVDSGGASILWCNIVGRDQIRVGKPSTYTINFGNSGNADAYAVPMWIAGLPDDVDYKLGFELQNSPNYPGLEPTDNSQIPLDVKTADGRAIPLQLPIIPAGFSGQLQITIAAPRDELVDLVATLSRPQLAVPGIPIPGTRYVVTSEDIDCGESIAKELANVAGAFTINMSASQAEELREWWIGVQADTIDYYKTRYLENNKEGAQEMLIESGARQSIKLAEVAAKIVGRNIPFVHQLVSAWEIGWGAREIWKSCQGTYNKVTGDSKVVKVVSASDPNEKSGSSGFGPTHYVEGGKPLSYGIFFENKADATAAAQEVVVTDQLDPSIVDLDSFALSTITFGNHALTPPAGRSNYTGFVDLRPDNNLIVRVQAGLDNATGLVTWRFQSIDPLTGELTADPIAGFLPPNVNAPEGDGGVTFSVRPKDNSTEVTVDNKARIIFDANDPIDTNTWHNQLDFNSPQSRVTALPATSESKSVDVSWSGTDVGSGIATYSVFVSKNGGAFESWLSDVTQTSAKYFGESGQTYAFYSVAKDNAGNVEAAPITPDAQTYIIEGISLSIEPMLSVLEGNRGISTQTFKVTLSQASSKTVQVNYATSDRTALAGSDYIATSGNLKFESGTTVQTITVPIKGDTINETDEQFFVKLSSPTNAVLSNAQSIGKIINDDALPMLKVADMKIVEGNAGTKTLSFTATLSAKSGQVVRVNYATSNGTALSGSDYNATRGTLAFLVGQTAQTFTIPIKGDVLDEADETFFVNLSGAVNATLARPQIKATIVDDDAPPALTIGDMKVSEGNSGTRTVTFPLRLSAPSGLPVEVSAFTKNGTAQAGSDYNALPATKVTFKPGVTTAKVTVTLRGDKMFESDETFIVVLTKSVNATLKNKSGVGTIVNDDRVPTLSIGDVKVIEGNAGNTNAVFTLTLSTTSSQNVKVIYGTANGTALSGSDYNSAQGTVTFASGQNTKTVSVAVKGDTVHETGEKFYLNLSGVVGAILARKSATGTITNDDK